MRVSIKTLGCRLNQAESADLAGRFVASGFEVVPFGEPCDACLIHSCGVTAAAESETVRLTRAARRRLPSAIVVLAGCVAETAAADVLSRSGADWIIPQDRKAEIPARLAAHFNLRHNPATEDEPVTPAFDSTRALLRIQEGCSFGCAYCIVPRARGPARSRPMDTLLAEARSLVQRGHKELVLTGTNIGTWQHGAKDLVDLLAALEGIAGLDRIRVGSVEPATVELRLIDHMALSSKLCRHLHLPLQSGDDTILNSMGRRYTVALFREAVEKAVSTIPLVGLGTDIVTGFPGESEAAFDNTAALLRDYPFCNLHVFPYSERPGTRAATMPGSVGTEVRRARARELIAMGENMRQAFAGRFVGKPVTVLVERFDRDGNAVGWTSEYLEAVLSGPSRTPNQIVTFTPLRAVRGRLMDDPQP